MSPAAAAAKLDGWERNSGAKEFPEENVCYTTGEEKLQNIPPSLTHANVMDTAWLTLALESAK